MIAIIPARSGSKGLPGKNIRLFNNIPLICHTIECAQKSKNITRVVVSTDDDEIASISRNYGAEVPCLRPAKLASDTSMAMDAYLHMIDFISQKSLTSIEAFLALLPTVPLRESIDIDNAIQIYRDKDADSVISVTESPVPIYWYRKINAEGILVDYKNDFDATLNRQEVEITYIPNGAVYVFNTEKLRSSREYYLEKTYPYIMPKERSIDIDTLSDFEYAEYLFKKNKC